MTQANAIAKPVPAPNAGAARDRLPLWLVVAGIAIAYVPTYWDFLFGVWAAYSQGHEIAVLAVAAFLVFRRRELLAALPDARTQRAAAVLLAVGVCLYVFGRSQQLMRVELASQFFVLAAAIVGLKGFAGLRLLWFPMVFLLFVIPLPYAFTLALTGPLKAAASAATTSLLAALGYPIGRSGVVITIGQYQLLVATACAGLQTMFTLEALGLLYANLKGYRSWLRNALLGLLALPVSFIANVIRVMLLTLVTYHFGDAAGRGFAHWFAGIALFLAALLLIVAVDGMLGRLLPARHRR